MAAKNARVTNTSQASNRNWTQRLLPRAVSDCWEREEDCELKVVYSVCWKRSKAICSEIKPKANSDMPNTNSTVAMLRNLWNRIN